MGAVSAVRVTVYALLPQLVLLAYGSQYGPVAPYLGMFAITLSLLAFANLLINYLLSVGSGRFVLPLVAACVLETTLISRFHRDPRQILQMLLATIAALCAVIGGLYLSDRLRPRISPSASASPARAVLRFLPF